MEESMSMSKLINLNPRTYWEDIRYIKKKSTTANITLHYTIYIAKQHCQHYTLNQGKRCSKEYVCNMKTLYETPISFN